MWSAPDLRLTIGTQLRDNKTNPVSSIAIKPARRSIVLTCKTNGTLETVCTGGFHNDTSAGRGTFSLPAGTLKTRSFYFWVFDLWHLLGAAVQVANPDYSRSEESARHSVHRCTALEERRQQRQGFGFRLQIGTRLELFAGVCIRKFPLANSWQPCFAFAPQGLRLDRHGTTNHPG
jgi:hypothetical protein